MDAPLSCRYRAPRSGDGGYAMAALIVAISVMAIMLSMAMPVWRTAAQRERETELVFRGEQYAQAIELFSRRNGGFPTSFEALRAGRYIRKLYKDPITDDDFRPVFLGQIAAGAPGVPIPGRQGAPPGGPGRQGGSIGSQPTSVGGGRAQQPPSRGGIGQAPSGAGRDGQLVPGSLGQPGAAAGPIIGVVSMSTAESLRQYNGRGHYNEWMFVSTAATRQAGAPGGAPGAQGTQSPGVPGRGGRAVGPGGPGRGATPGRGGPRGGNPPPGAANPFGRTGGFPQTNPNSPGRP